MTTFTTTRVFIPLKFHGKKTLARPAPSIVIVGFLCRVYVTDKITPSGGEVRITEFPSYRVRFIVRPVNYTRVFMSWTNYAIIWRKKTNGTTHNSRLFVAWTNYILPSCKRMAAVLCSYTHLRDSIVRPILILNLRTMGKTKSDRNDNCKRV